MLACKVPILSTDPAQASAMIDGLATSDDLKVMGGPQHACSNTEGADAQRAGVLPLRDVHRMVSGGFHHRPS
jgi:hypothetical protein